jgi:hypothetical protein
VASSEKAFRPRRKCRDSGPDDCSEGHKPNRSFESRCC